jgi:hypothetical protein
VGAVVVIAATGRTVLGKEILNAEIVNSAGWTTLDHIYQELYWAALSRFTLDLAQLLDRSPVEANQCHRHFVCPLSITTFTSFDKEGQFVATVGVEIDRPGLNGLVAWPHNVKDVNLAQN